MRVPVKNLANFYDARTPEAFVRLRAVMHFSALRQIKRAGKRGSHEIR